MDGEQDIWQEIKKTNESDRAWRWNVCKWYLVGIIAPIVLVLKGRTGIVSMRNAWKLKSLDTEGFLSLVLIFGIQIVVLILAIIKGVTK